LEENMEYYEKFRLVQKMAAEVFAAMFLDLEFNSAYIDVDNRPHLYLGKIFKDSRARGIFENIGKQFVELEFFNYDYYNEPQIKNPYNYEDEDEENLMWDLGREWAVYIADRYFEAPDFVVGLLLEDEKIDRSVLKMEAGFIELVDEIKGILEKNYDCEQFQETNEVNDEEDE
jgi:hypothetical protein